VERRCYAATDYLFHPNISSVQYNVFFNLCRLKGIQFDLQDKVLPFPPPSPPPQIGTAFLLLDSFASGMVGVLSVDRNTVAALRMLFDALEFIHVQLGASKSNAERFLPEGTFRVAVHELKAAIDRLTLKVDPRA
jgi:hypothetical protein